MERTTMMKTIASQSTEVADLQAENVKLTDSVNMLKMEMQLEKENKEKHKSKIDQQLVILQEENKSLRQNIDSSAATSTQKISDMEKEVYFNLNISISLRI